MVFYVTPSYIWDPGSSIRFIRYYKCFHVINSCLVVMFLNSNKCKSVSKNCVVLFATTPTPDFWSISDVCSVKATKPSLLLLFSSHDPQSWPLRWMKCMLASCGHESSSLLVFLALVSSSLSFEDVLFMFRPENLTSALVCTGYGAKSGLLHLRAGRL